MGPPRRKGSGRAAAAAAAQQQWKVGDLVLAKMRGFPAWPAMISEPEKWGFSAVRKKLFVYFYGTKQIAFCNYADIEAFTEEKKKSLLLKRQGKGADFVRALDEIIDIYETSKKDNESNSGDDEVEPSAEDMKCVRTRSNSSNFRNSSELGSHKLEAVCDLIETNDTVGSEEVSATSTADDSEKNLVIDNPIQMMSIVDQLRQDPLATTTTSRKKRLRDASPNSSLLQKRVPSLRRSRSSLIADSSKIQESTSVYDSVPSNELTPDAIQNENAESKSKQSLSHTLYFHDMDVHCSTGLPSNDCSGEVGTETAEKDYENNKLNGCVVESSYHLETSTNGYLENKDRSNRNLKVSMKSLDFKKRSKPNRKRVDNAAECSESNKEDDLQVVLSNSPPNSLSEMKETIHKADGDEHLPLVKRARVRMGKSVVEETQHDEVVCGDDKFEASSVVNNCDEHYISFTVGNNSTLDGTPLTNKDDLNSSSGNNCSPPSGKDLMFWKVKKYHLKGSMLDVEAALPPSKRLHRALEAMSANATELIDDRPESPKAREANISMDSSKMNSLHLSSDSKFGSPASLQTIQTSDWNTFAISPSRLPLQDLGTPSLVSSEVKPCDSHTEVVKSSHNNNCNEILEDVAKCNGFNASKAIVTSATTRIKCQLSCSSKSVEEEVNVASTEGMSNKGCSMLGKVNEDTMEDKEVNHYVCAGNRDETVEPIIHKQDVFSNAEESVNFFPPDEAVLTVSAADMGSIASSTCGTTMSSSFQSDEDSQTGDMQGTVKQTQRRQTPNGRCISPDLTPMKALLAAAQAKRILSRSTSFSHNYSDGKVVPETISPSLVHKGDSSGHDSPPNGSVNHTFTVDDRVHVLQNGSRSPHISLHLKGINRYSHAEANAARKTFEALLCTLSRTKESIGRATRHAIDCAKYGMAGEVIELLLQNLEREQSLHKRVDLFFLVDSITQCSRNQKGGPGDVYPSLVQSVLPRLLSAAAPRGNSASENRRQCLKVLRLWLERKTLPESIIRQHMRELDCANELPFSSGSSRRPSRTERAINDPLREMEGMLVDEYGSNTNFQLPYLLRTNVLEDEEGNASEEKSFEAVTPERCVEIDHEKGATQTSTEKNRHVLEDVDVELEMEDVSPPLEEKMNSSCHVAGADTVHSHHQTDQQYSLPFAPPLPEDRPPSPPPLPSSPPPVSPCPTAHVPQWQSAAHALADAADFHPSRNIPNMQNQPSHFFSQQPSNQNAGMMSSKPAPYYGPSYGCGPSQMPPPASVSYCSMPASHPSVHSRSLASTSLTDTGYHLQPPPPRVSSQFSYVQAESQQRAQPWGNCSFPERFQYVHDRHRGNFHGDKGTRGPFQHEMVTRSSFPSAQQPGPSTYDKIEGPSTLPPYGRPPEPPSMPSNGWSLPPRMSNYSIPASRPSVEGPTPKMAGACGYWRPR